MRRIVMLFMGWILLAGPRIHAETHHLPLSERLEQRSRVYKRQSMSTNGQTHRSQSSNLHPSNPTLSIHSLQTPASSSSQAAILFKLADEALRDGHPNRVSHPQQSRQFHRITSAAQNTTLDVEPPVPTPPENLSPGNLPATKLIAIFVAPSLVLVLLAIALWTLYRKGILTGCIPKKKRKYSHARANLLQEQMRGTRSTESLTHTFPLRKASSRDVSQKSDSIPEYSEWLESVHGDESPKNSFVMVSMPSKKFAEENASQQPSPPNMIRNQSTRANRPSLTRLDTNFMHPPPPALSSSRTVTTKPSYNSDLATPQIQDNTSPYEASYQNTHILGTLGNNNAWKLGGLKYTAQEQRSARGYRQHIEPKREHVDHHRQASDERNRGMTSWWLGSKASESSLSSSGRTKSWWSRKSTNPQKESKNGGNSLEYDSFHVW